MNITEVIGKERSHDLKMADNSKVEGCAVLAKSLKDQVNCLKYI
jgi:hypothetical protein